jgi:hypothetical protein
VATSYVSKTKSLDSATKGLVFLLVFLHEGLVLEGRTEIQKSEVIESTSGLSYVFIGEFSLDGASQPPTCFTNLSSLSALNLWTALFSILHREVTHYFA